MELNPGRAHQSPSGWTRLITQGVANLGLTPLRATLLYLGLGFAFLFFSDVLLVWVYTDPFLQTLQTIKGALEVLVTGGIIFGLTYASRASLRQRTTELERNQTELQILHRILRHNLRNHLTILHGQCVRLHDQLTDRHQEETCDELLDIIDTIIRVTEQAQEIRKVTGDSTVQIFDLAELLPDLLDAHEYTTPDIDVALAIPEQAPVRANRKLDEAIAELVTNAIQHNDPTEVELSITVDPDRGPPGLTMIEVADTGTGVPDHVNQVLTDGEHDELAHLTGLGLWFVYLTVLKSDGQFSIVETGPSGNTVRLFVPTATADKPATSQSSTLG